MPTGAHWTLRYDPTVDERIQARVDANLLRRDEFVQSVRVHVTRTSCTLEVQFYDDRDRPYDSQLQRLEWRQPLPPPEAIPQRTQDEILAEYLSHPVQRRGISVPWNPIRRNLDYTAVARRTFLVEYIPETLPAGVDPPYVPGGAAQLGSEVHNYIEEISQLMVPNDLFRETRIRALGTPEDLVTDVPLGIPDWVTVGAWVQQVRLRSNYASIVEIKGAGTSEVFVVTRGWKDSSDHQQRLKRFLNYWTPCEKPVEPLSRYERIRRSF